MWSNTRAPWLAHQRSVSVQVPVTLLVFAAASVGVNVCANQKCPSRPPPTWWKSIFEGYRPPLVPANCRVNLPELVVGEPQGCRTGVTESGWSSTISAPLGSEPREQVGGYWVPSGGSADPAA